MNSIELIPPVEIDNQERPTNDEIDNFVTAMIQSVKLLPTRNHYITVQTNNINDAVGLAFRFRKLDIEDRIVGDIEAMPGGLRLYLRPVNCFDQRKTTIYH